MFDDKKVVVVMPAFNAAETLRRTYQEVMAQGVVDEVIVVDDASHDETAAVAGALAHTTVHIHPKNQGYGANQKSCYKLALESHADIVIMVHPDYQYTPLLIPAMASMIGNGLYHCILGSRILGGYALKGGMPLWKIPGNGRRGSPLHQVFQERGRSQAVSVVDDALALVVPEVGIVLGEPHTQP